MLTSSDLSIPGASGAWTFMVKSLCFPLHCRPAAVPNRGHGLSPCVVALRTGTFLLYTLGPIAFIVIVLPALYFLSLKLGVSKQVQAARRSMLLYQQPHICKCPLSRISFKNT